VKSHWDTEFHIPVVCWLRADEALSRLEPFAYVTAPFSLYSSFKALTRILFARRQRDRKVSQCQKDMNKIGETDGTCITSLNSLYSFHRKTTEICKQKIIDIDIKYVIYIL